MADLMLDTGALADVVCQYILSPNRNAPQFRVDDNLSQQVVRLLNRNIREDSRFIVAASSLAFVELAYNWDKLVKERIQPYQLAIFLHQPPEWFVVEPMDENILSGFGQVPPDVQMPNGRPEVIEWTDAVHLATAFSREECQLVTSDRRLLQVAPNETISCK